MTARMRWHAIKMSNVFIISEYKMLLHVNVSDGKKFLHLKQATVLFIVVIFLSFS